MKLLALTPLAGLMKPEKPIMIGVDIARGESETAIYLTNNTELPVPFIRDEWVSVDVIKKLFPDWKPKPGQIKLITAYKKRINA